MLLVLRIISLSGNSDKYLKHLHEEIKLGSINRAVGSSSDCRSWSHKFESQLIMKSFSKEGQVSVTDKRVCTKY